MKRISLENLEFQYKIAEYFDLYKQVMVLLESGKLKPVKASGKNGKKPALYKEYWVVEEQEDFSQYEEELLFEYVPMISTEYYFGHKKQYVEDREWVRLLNEYLKRNREKLQIPKSINERSFEIWHREKFLKEEQGKKILKRCGLSLQKLNLYETTEPMSYYVHTRQTPQVMLILENKDTFYSMRKFLLDGKETIFGIKIGTLIYGSGKGIFRSFWDFFLCAEPYMKASGNQLYYLGDLDYEGILIYEVFAEREYLTYKEEANIQVQPFIEGYLKMLEKAKEIGSNQMPEMKKGQNHNIGITFFSYFSEESVKDIKELLKKGRYIPQEIVSLEDF